MFLLLVLVEFQGGRECEGRNSDEEKVLCYGVLIRSKMSQYCT